MPASLEPENLERNLTCVGLSGMIDPVRPEVRDAIAKCREAGIRPIMITGDHMDTAIAIGKELGIISDASQAITDAQLNDLSEDEFAGKIEQYSVNARVQPEHKVRIVNAWKAKGKITAMTGDGVNDAPSIKSADIGVGMGVTGTDVTKNVADIMQKKPRDPKEGVFAGGMGFDVFFQGAIVTVLVMISSLNGHYMESGVWEFVNSPDGTTIAFLTLSMVEIFHSLNMRSRRGFIFSLKTQNKYLYLAMGASLVLTSAVIEIPMLAAAFDFTVISLAEYAVALLLAVVIVPVMEVVKSVQRRMGAKA